MTAVFGLGLTACGKDGSAVIEPPDVGNPDSTPPVVASVSLAPPIVALIPDQEVQMTASVKTAATKEIPGRTVVWISANESVANVQGTTGYGATISAVDVGSTTVTATVDGVVGSTSVDVSSTPVPTTSCTAAPTAWIWCDDFETDRFGSYFEYDDAEGRFVRSQGAGRDGSFGMRARWNQGDVGAGSLHLAVGRTPQAYFASVDDGTSDYRELYWRLFVRLQPGWRGGGADKLSRAFIFSSSTTWAQAMMAHVWSGGDASTSDQLGIDPASGTNEAGAVQTTQYNDFANFRWLGAKFSDNPMFNQSRAGTWYCVEARARLNDAGSENGVFQLWIDDVLEAESLDLNWVGAYNDFGINAVFIENYWNDGSPADQERYFDDLVVSTDRIGCG